MEDSRRANLKKIITLATKLYDSGYEELTYGEAIELIEICRILYSYTVKPGSDTPSHAEEDVS